MRYETQTIRIGEKVGPIDWGYDFRANAGGFNPDLIDAQIDMLRRAEAGNCEATTDGGWPRVGWGRVLDTGMYDGWPHWAPTPAVYIAGALGGGWHQWYAISEVRELPE